MKGFFGKSGWTLAALLLAISGIAVGAHERAVRQGDVKKTPEKANEAKNAEKGRNAGADKGKIRLEKKKREWASGSQ